MANYILLGIRVAVYSLVRMKRKKIGVEKECVVKETNPHCPFLRQVTATLYLLQRERVAILTVLVGKGERCSRSQFQ
jgi:hypothetical protein